MNPTELTRQLHLLREIGELAEHASLTGAMASGAGRAVARYNAVLRFAEANALLSPGTFEPLSEATADFGTLAVEARMLRSYLESPSQMATASEPDFDLHAIIRLAPFAGEAQLSDLVRDYVDRGHPIDMGALQALAPFLPEDSIGELIRAKLSRTRPAAPPTPPAPPAPPAPPTAPETPLARPTPDSLESLAAELRRPDLSVEERQQIALRLAQIAHEEASGPLHGEPPALGR